MKGRRDALSKDFFRSVREESLGRRRDGPLRNSILNVGLNKTAMSHDSKVDMRHIFSIDLKTGKATAQEKSGRCWLFAGLNTMRYRIMKDLNLKDFQLSQSYHMFHDKVEKANYFLENILE
ncbi:MAG: aminopeptidase, partial [Candidatus Aegiribacteria sp.]|nr:aminopeptidase [Candidatus Aegiribacteria sp.]MBD3294208.1 aminopeptidase [Candidatus Fermentibacteria bacterium]